MNLISAISRVLSRLEQALLIALLSGMIGFAFLQVVLRNVFSTSLLWADPMLRHGVLWIGFIGASLAAQQDKHITLDVISRFLSPTVSRLVRIVSAFFAATVTFFLARAGWTFLLSEKEASEIFVTIGSTEIPHWWVQTVIPFGFAIISLRFVLKGIEYILTPAAKIKPHEIPGI